MSTNTSLFDVTAPNWNDIPQADVTGTASVQGDGSVSLPTSQGDLHIAFHAFGVRLRIGKQGQADYGLLVSTPDIIPADIVQSEQHTTLIAGDSKLLPTVRLPLSSPKTTKRFKKPLPMGTLFVATAYRL